MSSSSPASNSSLTTHLIRREHSGEDNRLTRTAARVRSSSTASDSEIDTDIKEQDADYHAARTHAQSQTAVMQALRLPQAQVGQRAQASRSPGVSHISATVELLPEDGETTLQVGAWGQKSEVSTADGSTMTIPAYVAVACNLRADATLAKRQAVVPFIPNELDTQARALFEQVASRQHNNVPPNLVSRVYNLAVDCLPFVARICRHNLVSYDKSEIEMVLRSNVRKHHPELLAAIAARFPSSIARLDWLRGLDDAILSADDRKVFYLYPSNPGEDIDSPIASKNIEHVLEQVLQGKETSEFAAKLRRSRNQGQRTHILVNTMPSRGEILAELRGAGATGLQHDSRVALHSSREGATVQVDTQSLVLSLCCPFFWPSSDINGAPGTIDVIDTGAAKHLLEALHSGEFSVPSVDQLAPMIAQIGKFMTAISELETVSRSDREELNQPFESFMARCKEALPTTAEDADRYVTGLSGDHTTVSIIALLNHAGFAPCVHTWVAAQFDSLEDNDDDLARILWWNGLARGGDEHRVFNRLWKRLYRQNSAVIDNATAFQALRDAGLMPYLRPEQLSRAHLEMLEQLYNLEDSHQQAEINAIFRVHPRSAANYDRAQPLLTRFKMAARTGLHSLYAGMPVNFEYTARPCQCRRCSWCSGKEQSVESVTVTLTEKPRWEGAKTLVIQDELIKISITAQYGARYDYKVVTVKDGVHCLVNQSEWLSTPESVPEAGFFPERHERLTLRLSMGRFHLDQTLVQDAWSDDDGIPQRTSKFTLPGQIAQIVAASART